MRARAPHPNSPAALAGVAAVVPVSSYRIGACRRRELDAPLVCLELTGDDGAAIRYGLADHEAFALAVGILRRLEAPPFDSRRALAAVATKLVDDLTERAQRRRRR